MTNKEAIYIIKNRLNTYYCTDEDLQALDLAIKALEEPEEVYLNGKDYDLYLEGYKQGKKDFERPQGKWVKSKDGYTRCDQCGSRGSAIKARFCHHCGADMRGKKYGSNNNT